MSDKKHIDRLFQERLKDLDVTPSPEVWSGIEAKLKEQNKPKRVIPIWWRASGVAALLLLFLALANFIFNPNSTAPNPSSIIVESPVSKSIENQNETTITSTDEADSIISKTKQDTLAAEEKSSATQIANQTEKESTSNLNKKTTLQHSNVSTLASNHTDKISKSEESVTNNAVVSQENKFSEVQTQGNTSKTELNESLLIPKDSKVALNEKGKSNETTSNSNSKLDTLSIESAIAATKAIPKVDQKSKKWNIQPNVAPVFYSSTGNGSHLDDQFINNDRSGEVNTSYGVAVGYALNNKLKIRSGVNNLKLSFNTNDVLLVLSPGGDSRDSPSLTNVSTAKQAENITFLSGSKDVSAQSDFVLNTNESNAINQNISYFEVPLELEYNILNKRFGINLIGGFSTFILDNNTIYSEGNNNRTLIGEATNINDISFSTNFGIGFDYNFSKRFNFNLEPTFKYQLNAYNNVYGNFKPYIIGVYTGFSYKF